MVWYTDKQVSSLLDKVLEQIPVNEPKLEGLRKFVKNKKENISKHI